MNAAGPLVLVIFAALFYRVGKSTNVKKSALRATVGFFATLAVCLVIGGLTDNDYFAGSAAALLSPLVALVSAKL